MVLVDRVNRAMDIGRVQCIEEVMDTAEAQDEDEILVSPPPKLQFKAKVKSAIKDFCTMMTYWEVMKY